MTPGSRVTCTRPDPNLPAGEYVVSRVGVNEWNRQPVVKLDGVKGWWLADRFRRGE